MRAVFWREPSNLNRSLAIEPKSTKEQTASCPEGLAIECARLIADLKCEEVIALNVKGLSQVTQYLVIGSGTSERQMYSVAEDVAELGEECGHPVFRSARERASNWMVVDFVDVIVHLFEPNSRAYYDLETLWVDAERLKWRREGDELRSTPTSS